MVRSIESREPGEEPSELSRLVKIAVIVGASLLPATPVGEFEPRNTPEASAKAEEEGKEMTEKECYKFWDTDLVVLKRLVEKQESENPLVAEMFKQRMKEFTERYNKLVDIKLFTKYAPTEHTALQGSILKEKGLEIMLLGPAIRDEFARYKKSGRPTWKKECDSSVIIGILHELDHARMGNIMTEGEPLDKKRMFKNELNTWAETCEHVIRPLLEGGEVIDPADMNIYNDWVEAGRSADSLAWAERMKKYYGNSY